jgi:hypothetical protein
MADGQWLMANGMVDGNYPSTIDQPLAISH